MPCRRPPGSAANRSPGRTSPEAAVTPYTVPAVGSAPIRAASSTSGCADTRLGRISAAGASPTVADGAAGPSEAGSTVDHGTDPAIGHSVRRLRRAVDPAGCRFG